MTPRADMEGSLIRVTDISDSCGGAEVWTGVSARGRAQLWPGQGEEHAYRCSESIRASRGWQRGHPPVPCQPKSPRIPPDPCQPHRPQSFPRRPGTLLSLALMQTWLWLYSRLKVCVSRRRHCGRTGRMVGQEAPSSTPPPSSLRYCRHPGPLPSSGALPSQPAPSASRWGSRAESSVPPGPRRQTAGRRRRRCFETRSPRWSTGTGSPGPAAGWSPASHAAAGSAWSSPPGQGRPRSVPGLPTPGSGASFRRTRFPRLVNPAAR